MISEVAVDKLNNQINPIAHAKSICAKARRLWLQPKDNESLNEAELLYRQIWSCHDTSSVFDNDVDHSMHRVSKKSKVDITTHIDENNGDTSWVRHAGEKLALILLQSGRSHEADQILSTLQYTCRLSDLVLNYPSEYVADSSMELQRNKKDNNANEFSATAPYRAYDHFVTDDEMQMFHTVFADPNNDYWKSHNYSVEPPSPYFSYLIPLRKDYLLQRSSNNNNNSAEEVNDNSSGGIFAFVQRLQNFLQSHFPVKNASYCEMWAHNRYHATGHQFHFDSDNEGCTEEIRNPICSCIVYLSDNRFGGPSIITNQRLTSNTLATKGWMCHPQLGRLVVFDGTVLHGVVPGKGVVSDCYCAQSETNDGTKSSEQRINLIQRRVSVMFAFWRKIRVRDSDDSSIVVGGAAKSLPESPMWAKVLREPIQSTSATTTTTTNATTTIPSVVEALALDHIYVSTNNGRPWTRSMGMPNYEEIFQGF